jgi:predicted GNAT family N-acyltransferase
MPIVRPPTKVRIAPTDAEREEIYRLRYSVYVEEMHGESRHREANVASKLLYEDLDRTAYNFYVVRENRRVVACGRMNFRPDSSVECEEHLAMSRFVPSFPDHVSMSSRLVLHPSLRGSHLLKELVCMMYRFAREHDVHFDFIDCHPRLLTLYSRLGHLSYTSGFRHPKYVVVVPMVLVFDDLEHLNSMILSTSSWSVLPLSRSRNSFRRPSSIMISSCRSFPPRRKPLSPRSWTKRPTGTSCGRAYSTKKHHRAQPRPSGTDRAGASGAHGLWPHHLLPGGGAGHDRRRSGA